ncbi:complement factor H isoform X2 [Alligator mississippiensis]|uniref:complement factor H isoform X2 n=1 Tax=Alligator mississippiensis TaxID=8496 RepID=UPI002877BB75|nr:complement factor H isoform X2 [Alligator mississippiensis]
MSSIAGAGFIFWILRMTLVRYMFIQLLWAYSSQEEVQPCDYPQVENIELSGYYQSNREQAFPAKIGSSTYYRCAQGYVTATEENWVLIRCTRDGWDPAPKCINLENGGTGYWHWKKFKEGETISYSCHRGYIPENQQDRIMCAKDGWSPTPRCIPEITCPVDNLANGIFHLSYWTTSYHLGDRITYSCNSENDHGNQQYIVICTKNDTCKKVEITHGYFTEKKDIFNLNEETTYRCVIGYTTPDGNETGNTRCIHTRWSPSPGCSKTCTRPNLENILLKTNKTVFSLGHDLIYECVAGYQTIHKITIDYTVCGRNGWIPEPQCLAIECEMLTLPNGEMSPREGKYHNGDVVTFSCAKGYTRVGPDSAQCYYFGWSPTPPLCKDELRFCEQPPAIHNGSIISECQQQYPHGSTMEYRCNHRFKMIGSSKIECIDGAWSPLPSCTEAKKKCPPPPQVPGALKVTEMRNYESGEEIPFQCLENFEASAEVDKIMCKDGKWQSPPRCIEKYVCRSPRPLENGKLRQEHQNLGMEQSGPITYPDDAVLEYTCNTGFVLNGRSEIICNMGTWTAAPTCDEMPCGKVPSVLHSLPRRGEKNHYKAGITVRYECKRGFKIHGEQNIICQAGNWTKPPTCEEFFGKCGPPPAIENGDITSFPLKQYDQDSRVEYKCQHLYVMEGSQFATCNVGEWTEPPTCIEPCTVSEEDLEKNNIKLKWTPVGKLYSASGDFIDFVCKEGYVKDPTSPPFRVQCLKGKLSYPQCSL